MKWRGAPEEQIHRGAGLFPFLLLHMLAHMQQGVFLQAGNLRLADADFPGHLHLRPSLEEAQAEDLFFPLVQVLEGVLDGDFLQPVFILGIFVLHLVHNVKGVAPIVINGLKEGDGVLNGFQGKDHILHGKMHLLGDFVHGGFPSQGVLQPVPGL